MKQDGAVKGATSRARQLNQPESVQAGIQPPSYLEGAALAYWQEVAPQLIAIGNLAPAEVPQFAEVCECFGILQALKRNCRETGKGYKSYQDMLIQFRLLCQGFALFPVER